jgi:hypothetical protein
MEMRASCSRNVGKLIESIESLLVTIQSVCLLMLTPPFPSRQLYILILGVYCILLLSWFHFPCHFWMSVCLYRRSYRPVFFFQRKYVPTLPVVYYSPAREFISLPFHCVARECHLRSGNFYESEKLLRCRMCTYGFFFQIKCYRSQKLR